MTSMPASRSARATTLAPRSCPSSPGFAMRTRIGVPLAPDGFATDAARSYEVASTHKSVAGTPAGPSEARGEVEDEVAGEHRRRRAGEQQHDERELGRHPDAVNPLAPETVPLPHP